MFASNKTFGSFNCPQKSFGFVSVNCVLNVLLMGYQFQISQLIVRAIKVFMVNLQFAFDWAIKCFPHHAMYAASKIFSVFAQINNRVAFNQPIFNGSMCRFTSPSFAQLDGMGCGYASAQKISDLFQGRTLLKHFFCFWNFCSVKRFASSNTAHIPKIANFVQIFKAENWFPCFHSVTPFKVNRSIA